MGILFYLGTTIAASMYITGAVEIFLVSNPFSLFPFPSFLSSSSHSFFYSLTQSEKSINFFLISAIHLSIGKDLR